MKKVLLTGFEPFGGETMNPAYEAVRNMRNEIAGAQILKLEIPVVYHEGANRILQVMESERPDLVISVGQAGGRAAVTPERIAVNLQDASVPDNAGHQYQERPIYEDGPAAYFSTLPIRRIVTKLLEAGIPSSISNSAGLYVCNDVMYHILYWMERKFPYMRGGFIHVPYACEQVLNKPGQPSLPLSMLTEALEIAVEAALTNDVDAE